MKLLLADKATLACDNDLDLSIFDSFGTVDVFDCIARNELLEIAGEYDVILCNKTIIDREVLSKAQRLKYIGLFATGYNNIDIDAAKDMGVTVCNAGSYSTNAVAQQTFAYILAHFTATEKYNSFVKSGGWITSPVFSVLKYPSDELAGKKIGIIGFGSIGQKVAKLALAFDMEPLVYTRTPKQFGGVSFVSLDELLRLSDIVTVHCPLNGQSRDMFDEKAFSKMKQGAFFINTARGGVVVEEALLNALKSGRLSGAAVDVLRTEPMSKDCVLLEAPNITITPHTSWAPLSTRERLVGIVADNLKNFLSGTPENVIV